MLEYLRLKNVGPAPEMGMDLGSRLNVITGDNGLGKTLLLDAAWYALTKTWPPTNGGRGLVPTEEGAKISWSVDPRSEEFEERWKDASSREYNFEEATWDRLGHMTRSNFPSGALTVYARVDGAFSVFDPYREPLHGEHLDPRHRSLSSSLPAVFNLRSDDVWDGLDLNLGANRRVCDGMIRDWLTWGATKGSLFRRFASLARALSPDGAWKLRPAGRRIFVDDARDIPEIETEAGIIPIVHASAAVRRMLAFAYVVLWAWNEHEVIAKLRKRPLTRSIVFLFDEIENHLHPRWQSQMGNVLVGLAEAMGVEANLQTIFTTHSPLVLASLEPVFDVAKDAWFDMDLVGEGKAARVVLEKRPFARMGTAGRWLTSAAFDLSSEGRAPRAVAVLEAAAIALSDPSFDKERAAKLDRELRSVLGDTDPFWTRWRFVGESRGWLPCATNVAEPPKAKKPKPRAKKPEGKT